MSMNKHNTCFLIEQQDINLLVDCSGGHEILMQFDKHNVLLNNIDAIFVTHTHFDHILGIVFLFRKMIEEKKRMKIICSQEVKERIMHLIHLDIPKYLNENNHLLDFQIIEENAFFHNFKFFLVDKKQHGFFITGKAKIAFTGDIPCKSETMKLIKGCDTLIHEAFCSSEDNVVIRGNHSTIEHAINIFKMIGAKKLIVTHTKTNLRRFNSDNIKVVEDGDIVII